MKRGNVIDVFHVDSGLWYVGTIAKLVPGEDGVGPLMKIHYPHHESEDLSWNRGMYRLIISNHYFVINANFSTFLTLPLSA